MSWLNTVKDITTGDRRRDYGHPLLNFLRIALFFNTHLFSKLRTGCFITPLDVAGLMVELKLAREINTHKEDNWVDIIGYTACVEMMDELMKELGYPIGVHSFEHLKISEWYEVLDRAEHHLK